MLQGWAAGEIDQPSRPIPLFAQKLITVFTPFSRFLHAERCKKLFHTFLEEGHASIGEKAENRSDRQLQTALVATRGMDPFFLASFKKYF